MTNTQFINSIQNAFQKDVGFHSEEHHERIQFFLNALEKISSLNLDAVLLMTSVTILFEGFYRYLDSGELKYVLTQIRIQRWQKHFGTPTLAFLLSYKQQIDETEKIFWVQFL